MPEEQGLGDERGIIARCLAGEREAYAVLVERYKGLVHDLVCRMLGQSQEAEDVSQDAFVRAFLSLKDFRGESRFSTWLCRIAMNRCKDILRRRGREPWAVADLDGVPVADAVDERETPAVTLERREREQALHRALAKLPVKYREALVLRHIEGMDVEEVGALLGISAAAAKVRMFRGRQMLQQLLGREGLRDDAV